MLVVDSVLPGGPADGKLQPGDALVRLNGTFMTAFLPMEELLDSAVGQSVNLEVDRAGSTVEVSVTVQVSQLRLPLESRKM
jgi:C-terminal processing protease CtpA/Prc